MLYRIQTFLCSVGILHRTKLLTGGRPPGALEPEKWPDWQDCQVAKCDEFRLFLQCSTSNLPFYLFYFNWTWCCNHGRIAHIELATSPSPALTSRLNLFHKLKSKPQYDMVMDMNFGEKKLMHLYKNLYIQDCCTQRWTKPSTLKVSQEILKWGNWNAKV